MPSSVDRYKVFIASPNDVAEEWGVVRKVCEELNEDPFVIGKNIHFSTTGWEDVVPSAERPQQIINRELKDCDLFVCVFYRRFGMHSGREESGTLEEFRQAYESWKKIKKPHILLYFKKVRDLEKEAENDPQLQKVSEFKNGIDRDHLLLYGEFETSSEFKGMLEKQMRLWIHDNIPAVTASAGALLESEVVPQQATGEVAGRLGAGRETDQGRMAEQGLQLLHISDLHMDLSENFDRSVVLDPLISRVKEDRKKGLKPEIVVVTGDVAATGIAEEYEQAVAFLDQLAGALELPRERFFIVPGNHDVNRKKYRKSDVPFYENMRELNEELESSEFREELLKGMKDYFGFIESRYPHLKSENGKLVPFVNTHITASGRRIALVGLNSSWMCRKSPDEKEIAVGEYQVKKAMEELEKGMSTTL